MAYSRIMRQRRPAWPRGAASGRHWRPLVSTGPVGLCRASRDVGHLWVWQPGRSERHFGAPDAPAHWDDIARTLGKDEVYVPLLPEDKNGVTPRNDWARSFLRGAGVRHDGWKTLLADEDHARCM